MAIEKYVTQMSDDEFQKYIDGYTPPDDPPDAATLTFFKLLYESSKKRVKHIIPLTVSIEDGQVQFHLPPDIETTVEIRNNEILVGDRRLVVTLQNGNEQHSPSKAPLLLT